MPLARSVCVHP